jgi:uncharacterized protein (DUF1697 family)
MTFIAMLRGINVSGQKLIKMERLRTAFADMGFQNVRTYIQSGNVIFETEEPAAGLSTKIQKKILKEFGFDVEVVTKSAKEMADIVKRNPLAKDTALDEKRLYVTFLADDPPRNAVELLQPLATNGEAFHIVGRAVYGYFPNGYGETKFSNPAIEKKLGCKATTRNWKTTKMLMEMASDKPA